MPESETEQGPPGQMKNAPEMKKKTAGNNIKEGDNGGEKRGEE